MTNKDGRVIAQENEVRVLRALHRFGWLRTKDLAALVWQAWSTTPAAAPSLKPVAATSGNLRMAQRTLRRMYDKRLVLRGRAPDGGQIYGLAESGKQTLLQMGIRAESGKDLVRAFSSAFYRHRCIANQIAIGAIITGYKASTEREIAQGLWLGGEPGIAGKRPDVLIRAREAIWWVEVERSRKNSKDYARLLAWLQRVAQDVTQQGGVGARLLGEKLQWRKVIFICTPAFRNKLLKDLAGLGVKKVFAETLLSFETELYNLEDISFN